ncbi:MAG: response regulator, partial [Pyrinomonadaceae bacterium]
MDCQMPEMDGYEATAAIREREKKTSTHTPIIAMTAHAIHGEREKCVAAGMDDYISKPVQKEVLYQMIEKWINAVPVIINTVDEASGDKASAGESVIDLALLKDLTMDDDDLLREIVEMYLEQTGQQLDEIGKAIEERNADALYKVSHKSVGGSATCGMKIIVPFFRELEQMGKNQQFENAENILSDARLAFTEISRECKNVIMEAAAK